MHACEDAKPVARVLVFRVDGPLFYANSERLKDVLEDYELRAADENNEPALVVMHAGPVSFVDSTAIQVFTTAEKIASGPLLNRKDPANIDIFENEKLLTF